MNRREKILGAITGTMASLFAIGVGVDRFVLQPAKNAESQVLNLTERRDKLRLEEAHASNARRELAEIGRRTYGTTTDEAVARVGQRITTCLREAGLKDRAFTRLPTSPRSLRSGAAREFGWSVQGVGQLGRVVDLIYLLDQEPQVHRIENLRVSPTREAGQVSVNFRYLSLLFPGAAPPAEGLPEGEVDLTGARRGLYEVIVGRGLFSPAGQKEKATSPEKPAGPDLAILKVVSLSEWNGRPEATILDLQKNSTFAVRPGEAVAGRTAVAVDYRPLPSRMKPGLTSFSRLVLHDSGGYWAVEAGATLADRYSLKTSELPPGVVEAEQSEPGEPKPKNPSSAPPTDDSGADRDG